MACDASYPTCQDLDAFVFLKNAVSTEVNGIFENGKASAKGIAALRKSNDRAHGGGAFRFFP